MAVNDLQELQRRMNTQSLRDDAQMVQGIPARGQDPVIQQDLNKGMRGSEFEVIEDPSKGMRGSEVTQPMSIPPSPPKEEITANRIFKDPVFVANAIKSITPKAVQEDVVKAEVRQEEAKITKLAGMLQKRIGGLDRNAMNFDPRMATAKDGGLIGMAAGGNFRGAVQGRGHGMEDNVFMPIKDRGEQVATLAVSPKEYVIDAHTMSALGNGNPDEGARYMDRMVKNIREKAYGTDQQPNEISGLTALRPMIERV
jgi:hypothetical protein